MEKFRRIQPERAVQQQLPGGGKQQVCAAHDFGYFHCGVVRADGQLVGRRAALAPYEEVPEVPLSLEAHLSEVAVAKAHALALARGESPVEGKRVLRGAARQLLASDIAQAKRKDGLAFGVVENF